MIINKVIGKTQRIMLNEYIALGIIDTNGNRTWTAYVRHTKTIHIFNEPNKMLDFTEHMGFISANETLTRDEFKQRMKPFVLGKWIERCKPGMDFEQASIAIQKGHTKHRGTGLMTESTWTEFDDHASFLIPKGFWLSDAHISENQAEYHFPGNGWSYEILYDVIQEFCEMFSN